MEQNGLKAIKWGYLHTSMLSLLKKSMKRKEENPYNLKKGQLEN